MRINKPLFTIITCTRNSEKYIEKNYISVRNQTFKNFEQIFIDGESSDTTLKKIRNYKSQADFSVKIIISKPKGISNAMNMGINSVKGEYIVFLNSDDFFYNENILKEVREYVEKNGNVDLFYGKINTIEENGQTIGSFPNQKIFHTGNKILIKYINYIPHQATFLRSRVFNDFGGFDETLTSKMDYELWLRIRKQTKWKYINRIISSYRVRKGAQSSSRKKFIENDLNLVKVRKKHLRNMDYIIARFVDFALYTQNKIYR
jgi:glycosyltransferase involved in cell wall biosynthesis